MLAKVTLKAIYISRPNEFKLFKQLSGMKAEKHLWCIISYEIKSFHKTRNSIHFSSWKAVK